MKKDCKEKNVKIIVERIGTGNVTPIQAILPFVMEDLKRKIEEKRTLEYKSNTG